MVKDEFKVLFEIPVSDEEDDIKEYLNKVASIPIFTENEEITLSIDIQKGLAAKREIELVKNNKKNLSDEVIKRLEESRYLGEKASAELAYYHQKYLVSVARKNLNKGLSFYELAMCGIDALKKLSIDFDYNRGIRFKDALVWLINRNIEKTIRLKKGN